RRIRRERLAAGLPAVRRMESARRVPERTRRAVARLLRARIAAAPAMAPSARGAHRGDRLLDGLSLAPLRRGSARGRNRRGGGAAGGVRAVPRPRSTPIVVGAPAAVRPRDPPDSAPPVSLASC